MLAEDIHDISCMEFGILSSEEIRNMAVIKVDSSKNFGSGSVYDEKMGCITDTNEKCATCGLKDECWGHFGYIDLAEPVLHPMFFKTISAFLKCFCKKCYRLLLLEDQLFLSELGKLKGERKFIKLLKKLEKIDICSHCSHPQPKIIYKTKDSSIAMEYKQKKGQPKLSIILEVDDIKKIFDNISEEDVSLLGLDPSRTHPKNLILTTLPVIPPCSRPYIIAEGNNICDDDLTYSLIEIVKINNQLGIPTITMAKRQKLLHSLRFRVSTMFNNSKGKAKHPTDSRALKCLKLRLGGKKGRIRDNLMGKRVNFSARTVIGAEPNLGMNKLGIPHLVAQTHTKPESVVSYNKEYLSKIVKDGKANFVITTRRKTDEKGEEYGPEIKTRINLHYAMQKRGTQLQTGDIIVRGDHDFRSDRSGKIVLKNIPEDTQLIRIITAEDTQRIDLLPGDRLLRNGAFIEAKPHIRKNITLKEGDIVERQLRPGDIGLFNRQPTLHRGSMLGMEVVPMDHMSFRFNLAIAKSFNADFDGDEMNFHAIQSYETEAEMRYISNAKLNIITAQGSKPIVTITQDSLVASYLMTKEDFSLSRGQFSDICMKGVINGNHLFDPIRIRFIEKTLKENGKPGKVFNGRGLFSLIFPPDFNYEKKNSAHPTEPVVLIRKGVFLEGAFDKSTLGSAHGSIIQLLNKEYGPDITTEFIDNVQFIGNAWLLVHGFSVGLEDCMITSEESVLTIKNKLTECYTKAEGIEETTQNPGIREIRITASLSQAKDIGMKIAKEAMKKNNNFLTTVTSGAKGDYFNISQITGLLGQQNLEGKRVSPTLSNRTRTLPHYPFPGGDGMTKEREYESRGFIQHSFIHGLNPEEFFFHAMSGREGVADTAMSTANSGYIQRKIVKVCEDIQVRYDQTVRDTTGKIYQFYYGDNGYDATKTVKVGEESVPCDLERLAERLNTRFELGMTEEIKDEVTPGFDWELLRREKAGRRKVEEVKEEELEQEEIEQEEDEEKEDDPVLEEEEETDKADEEENDETVMGPGLSLIEESEDEGEIEDVSEIEDNDDDMGDD